MNEKPKFMTHERIMAGEEYVSYSDYLLLQRERDEAREDATNYYAKIGELERERDEAREKAERYRLEANAMMLQRDESREVLREIAEASGFDNIGNWARNKAKSAIYR